MPISKNELKFIRSLHQKKIRAEHRLFIAEGRKVLEEALATRGWVDRCLTTDPAFAEAHPGCSLVSAREMDQLTCFATAPGYLAVLHVPDHTPLSEMQDAVVVLDGIRDPGNLGTIIRTADWFGVRNVICSEDCAEAWNPKTVQASMGSLLRARIAETSLPEALGALRQSGFTIVGASMQGIPAEQYAWKSPAAIVIGGESHGLRKETLEQVDDQIHISGVAGAESLNAAVAAGIILSMRFQAAAR